MSVGAIWQVSFGVGESEPVLGQGVLILSGGKVTGGDSSFFYRGEYTVDNDTISCRIRVERYTMLLRSVTGRDQATMILDGPCDGSPLRLTGYVEEDPSTGFTAMFERLAELP
jgi:hypothetical protein